MKNLFALSCQIGLTLFLSFGSTGCAVGMGSDHPSQTKAEPQLPFINNQANASAAGPLKPLPIQREKWHSSGATHWGGVRIAEKPHVYFVRPLDYTSMSMIKRNFQQARWREPCRAADLPKDEMGQVLALNVNVPSLGVATEQDWDSGELMYEFARRDDKDREALESRGVRFSLVGETLRVRITQPSGDKPGDPRKTAILNTIGRWCREAVLNPGAKYLAVVSADGPRRDTSVAAVYGIGTWIQYPGRRFVEFFDTSTWQTVGEPVVLVDSEACEMEAACWLSPEYFVAICDGRLWLVPFPKLALPPPDAASAPKPEAPATRPGADRPAPAAPANPSPKPDAVPAPPSDPK